MYVTASQAKRPYPADASYDGVNEVQFHLDLDGQLADDHVAGSLVINKSGHQGKMDHSQKIILSAGLILHGGNGGDCLRVPWSLPWRPWNTPVQLCNFIIACPLPRKKCLGALTLSKTKHTALSVSSRFRKEFKTLSLQKCTNHTFGVWHHQMCCDFNQNCTWRVMDTVAW